ncbi:MAG TPA: hypothetical protein VII19_00485, partial [Acidimicrobiales bacterium]
MSPDPSDIDQTVRRASRPTDNDIIEAIVESGQHGAPTATADGVTDGESGREHARDAVRDAVRGDDQARPTGGASVSIL